MSASQGGIDDKAVVEKFKEALTQRIGEDRFGMWFDDDVSFTYEPNESPDAKLTHGQVIVLVRGQFAVDRLRKNFIREMRAAATQACSCTVDVSVQLASKPAAQTELPLVDDSSDSPCLDKPAAQAPTSGGNPNKTKRGARSIKSLVDHRQPQRNKSKNTQKGVPQNQPLLPNLVAGQSSSDSVRSDDPPAAFTSAKLSATLENFAFGNCNQLAYTAAKMACENPRGASPLFLSGPTGVGKSHLMTAIADKFRRRHRYRRVIHLSAESFTNDFISSVGSSGLPAFRRRYRDVDALLIDDVQFLGSKRATLREMLYTVETLFDSGRPLIFSGSHAPTEIPGLSQELSGRLASGLVCPLQPLDAAIRETLLRRAIEQCCVFAWPENVISEVNTMLIGDGRVIQGVVHLVATLQRMYQRMPTMDEIHNYGGQLLRSSKPTVTLSAIERAVAQAFQLSPAALRSQAKTRTASEPRMLAMYLSRELTSAAYSEIGRHYGGRSHSTAIVASQKVKDWLENGKTVGRGAAALTAREALERIENIVRSA